MSSQLSTFIITRADRSLDPIRVVAESVKIGRLSSCEIILNHPTVSRLHAEIREFGGRFYILNFSQATPATINGRLIEQKEALADGDVVQIGPFLLDIKRTKDGLGIVVTFEVTATAADLEGTIKSAAPPPLADDSARRASENEPDALDVFWEKRQREKGKMERASPLRPRSVTRLGKARFNWLPTRDLVRPYPFSLFVWGLLIFVPLSVVAAYAYTKVYSPAPLSDPHERAQLTMQPAIAKEPNANSCTTCHTLKASMDSQCASCHHTEAFVSTVTKEHQAAGISCAECHAAYAKTAAQNDGRLPDGQAEHVRFDAVSAGTGKSFSSTQASLFACNECHNDANKRTYNGKSVRTPHKNIHGIGYPVVNGQWIWKGLTDEEWRQKPEGIQKTYGRKPGDNERAWLSKQFHGLHIYRVSINGTVTGDKNDKLSCSSCHDTFQPIDTKKPITTCAECHTGKTGTPSQKAVFKDDANCVSCHTQHVGDKRKWNANLIVDQPEKPVTLP